MASQMTAFATILQNTKLPAGVSPLAVNLLTPPKLEGSLAPNSWLTKVFKHAENNVQGPESMVVYKGHVYTGQSDGWVVHISPQGDRKKLRRMSMGNCERPGAGPDACGRPLGMRVDKNGYLVVADAYNGIIKIDPTSGAFQKLVDARTLLVNNKTLGYVNDLVVADDGKIFFTSSSSKWPITKENNIIFEAENSGRVLVYDPKDKQVQELVTKLTFPNGIELSKDNSYILIAEGTRARIIRAWINPADKMKRGTLDIFAENLPGIVDNIRRTPRGTYWVGISQARHRDLPFVLDTYGNDGKVREALIKMVNMNVKFENPKFGIAVELGGNGQVLRSLQDPKGETYRSVSEVDEEDGLLFFSSPNKNFVGVIKLDVVNSLPTDQATGGQGQNQGQSTTPSPMPETTPTTPTQTQTQAPPQNQPYDVSKDPRVIEFLGNVRRNMENMPQARIKDSVVELAKEMVMARRHNLYLIGLVKTLREQLAKLRQNFDQTTSGTVTTPTSSGGSATATAPTTAPSGGSSGGGTSTSSGGAGASTASPSSSSSGASTTASSSGSGTTSSGGSGSSGSSSSDGGAGGGGGESGTTTPVADTTGTSSDAGTTAGSDGDASTTTTADSTTPSASTDATTTDSSADASGTTAASTTASPEGE